MGSRRPPGDDLDLSLTGSQISARSSGSTRRPGSAGSVRRHNTQNEMHHSKVYHYIFCAFYTSCQIYCIKSYGGMDKKSI